MQIKVLDTNFINNSDLKEYLSVSKYNNVLLTEYFAMENYKETTGQAIEDSVQLLKNHSKQVKILKATIDICGLNLIKNNSRKSLIDRDQTDGFKQFCIQVLKKGSQRNKVYQSIELHRKAANFQLDRMLENTSSILDSFMYFQTQLTAIELKEIRQNPIRYSIEIENKICIWAHELSKVFFEDHPRTKFLGPPLIENHTSSFLFRLSVCIQFLFLIWIRNGSRTEIKNTKLRNDIIDMNFATFATYYDGILTRDDKLLEVFNRASSLILLKKW